MANSDERWAIVFARARAFSWCLVCLGSDSATFTEHSLPDQLRDTGKEVHLLRATTLRKPECSYVTMLVDVSKLARKQ